MTPEQRWALHRERQAIESAAKEKAHAEAVARLTTPVTKPVTKRRPTPRRKKPTT